MLKLITIITKFILVALTALLFASCNHSINIKSIIGSGHVTTENRTVQGDFKSIEVSNGIDLIIEQSDKTEITVEADDNLQRSITTTVENGVLIVACDYNSFINIESKKVTVKMPVIEALKASSASSINSTNTLKSENIILRTSSAASMNLKVKSDNISCKSSSGSSINIEGMALSLETTASSGSDIDAKDLLANEVNATASSGATISVHPIVSLTAKASSGSNVDYNTTPKSIEKRASSGASVDKI
ncbi:head GIN domain-containing protein [Flavobacterium frigoris]|uniref:Putative auto-transporter adhesin, head GIN domain n=1 Tax=Flavobacterium frigoris TaxID=229204 RepID=A0A1H9LE74_FLAFI|nr:head GIN domain-containing protein [Flavobacterium frigoris]SER09781.1 Putative auto-transporter adhesin, head GIN domain [Flavobacterium frigoris]